MSKDFYTAYNHLDCFISNLDYLANKDENFVLNNKEVLATILKMLYYLRMQRAELIYEYSNQSDPVKKLLQKSMEKVHLSLFDTLVSKHPNIEKEISDAADNLSKRLSKERIEKMNEEARLAAEKAEINK